MPPEPPRSTLSHALSQAATESWNRGYAPEHGAKTVPWVLHFSALVCFYLTTENVVIRV